MSICMRLKPTTAAVVVARTSHCEELLDQDAGESTNVRGGEKDDARAEETHEDRTHIYTSAYIFPRNISNGGKSCAMIHISL